MAAWVCVGLSQAVVQAAVTAASAGDTVYVPAGTANWSQQLAITKFIKLIGAGSDQTVITWTGGTALNYYDSQYYIITFAPVPVVSDLKWGISGIGFDLASKWHGLYLYNASATWLNNLRITDVDLLNPRGDDRAMRPVGNIAGVIDNCTFGGGIGIQGYGHENWNLYTCAPGSVRQLYFEDCDFVGQAGSVGGPGGGGGMAYVVRYCTYTIDETGSIASFHESHGNQPNNGGAMMNAEIYNNTYTSSVSTSSELFVLRGGGLICFGNTVGATGFTSSYIKVYEEYIDSCGGAYPINGDGLRQHPNRAYAWNNTRNSVDLRLLVPADPRYDVATQTSNASGGWVDYSEPTWPYYDAALASYGVVPQYDRDLFGYNPTFDGTANYAYVSGSTSYLNTGNVAGVGVGLLAARPASCAVTGAAWWATDTETLYRWTGSAWEAYFTPYTYPHPLRSV
jgi:hypothetical protein